MVSLKGQTINTCTCVDSTSSYWFLTFRVQTSAVPVGKIPSFFSIAVSSAPFMYSAANSDLTQFVVIVAAEIAALFPPEVRTEPSISFVTNLDMVLE